MTYDDYDSIDYGAEADAYRRADEDREIGKINWHERWGSLQDKYAELEAELKGMVKEHGIAVEETRSVRMLLLKANAKNKALQKTVESLAGYGYEDVICEECLGKCIRLLESRLGKDGE